MPVQTESHLIAALVAAGWWVYGQRMWVHECISGEYTLLEAVRMPRLQLARPLPRGRAANPVQDIQARLVRQPHVEENDIRARSRDALEALAPREGNLESVSGGGEQVAHLVREQLQIITDEHQAGHDTLPFDAPGNARRSHDIGFAILRVGPPGPYASMPVASAPGAEMAL